MLRGGQGSLRAELARAFFETTGRVASASAIADACLTLEGTAAQAGPEPVHLRVAQHGDDVIVDLGGPDGRVVIAGPTGWRLSDTAPTLFRRSVLTAAIPEPISSN